MMNFEYRLANTKDIESIWNKNIKDNVGDSRWINWKTELKNQKYSNFALLKYLRP